MFDTIKERVVALGGVTMLDFEWQRSSNVLINCTFIGVATFQFWCSFPPSFRLRVMVQYLISKLVLTGGLALGEDMVVKSCLQSHETFIQVIETMKYFWSVETLQQTIFIASLPDNIWIWRLVLLRSWRSFQTPIMCGRQVWLRLLITTNRTDRASADRKHNVSSSNAIDIGLISSQRGSSSSLWCWWLSRIEADVYAFSPSSATNGTTNNIE